MPDGLDQLRTRVDAPRALGEIGLREDDIEPAVALILPEVPPSNPRPVDAAVADRCAARRVVGKRSAADLGGGSS